LLTHLPVRHTPYRPATPRGIASHPTPYHLIPPHLIPSHPMLRVFGFQEVDDDSQVVMLNLLSAKVSTCSVYVALACERSSHGCACHNFAVDVFSSSSFLYYCARNTTSSCFMRVTWALLCPFRHTSGVASSFNQPCIETVGAHDAYAFSTFLVFQSHARRSRSGQTHSKLGFPPISSRGLLCIQWWASRLLCTSRMSSSVGSRTFSSRLCPPVSWVRLCSVPCSNMNSQCPDPES
jgi:hypothetical protein